MYLSKTGHTRTPDVSAQFKKKSLRSKISLSSLAHLARDPVGAVGEAVEGWRDGLTPGERAEKQKISNQKQILYCKLRSVSADSKASLIEPPNLNEIPGNEFGRMAYGSGRTR